MSDKQPERAASMLSAQINELRELSGDGSMEWLSGPVRASVLRDAADTIDRLRELMRDMRDCARDNQCSRCYFVSGKCAFADRMSELGVAVD